MKMNKLYQVILAGFSILGIACSEQEATTTLNDSSTLRITISDDQAATRTIVIDNPGIALETFWNAGDKIGVFGTNGQNISFEVAAEAISQNGKTADFKTTSAIPTGDLTAYYPYDANATMDGEALVLNFPTTQNYTILKGLPQPDPTACVMVGKGSVAGGISFVNTMAVLKIGQVFSKKTNVRSVEFRDLNGSPVTGKFKVSFSNGSPTTEFIGDGNVLTLDLGKSGFDAEANTLFNVFLVVPARDYPKGFEVTFVDSDGNRTVKTVGSKQGKTLKRSVVYPIGDVSTYENVPGMTYELKPTAQIMTPEKLDLVNVTEKDNYYVMLEDGSYAVKADGTPLMMPQLTMTVHKDMNPQVGGYLIFNQPSSDLPQGGIFKVKSCELAADGEHYEVFAVPEPNFAAPFEELTIGEPLYDEAGNLNENGGVEIDITSYVKEIRDGNGNVVSTRGIPTYDMNAAEAITRAAIPLSKKFKTPKLTLSMDDEKHCACDISAQMSVGMRLAIGIIHGETQYVYQTVNPTLDITTTFAIYGKYEKEKRETLMNFLIGGIPVGPLVVMPELGFDGFIGLGGEVKFSASTTFSYDLGTYGLAYNKGNGFQYRRLPTPAPESKDDFMPELESSLTGSIYAFGGIAMRAGLSISGFFSFGANTDLRLTFGIVNETNSNGVIGATKLHLTPELDIAPYTAVFNGQIVTVWRGIQGKIQFDPLWERYLTPIVESASTYRVAKLSDKFYLFDIGEDNSVMSCQVYTDFPKATYSVEVKKPVFQDLKLYLQVMEGDIEYSNIQNQARIEAMKADGAAHVAYMLGECDAIMVGDTRISDFIYLDTYASGTDGATLKGECPLSLKSGKAYSFCLVWRDNKANDATEDVYISSYTKPIIYYWPNNANGVAYKEDKPQNSD